MELMEHIRLFRRWMWFIFIVAFISGSAAFIYQSNQPLMYKAQIKIAIGGLVTSADPDSNQIRAAFDMSQTYAELATTYNVLDAVVQTLDLPISTNVLHDSINTSVIADTSLLIISCKYSDPVLVADIVNEVGRQLILQSPTNLTADQQTQVDIANEQIQMLTDELRTLREHLNTIDIQIEATTDQNEIDRLIGQRDTWVNQINQATTNIATFSNTIASLQQRTNSVDIVESARIPTESVGSRPLVVAILGLIVGGGIAMGGVLLVEYMNESFRTSDQVAQILALPVLGTISRYGKTADSYEKKLIIRGPFSQAQEQYRALRVNLLFENAEEGEMQTYLITSPAPMDGKSLTAANLAVSLAMADKQVLLIDADLRRPKIHEIFNVPNTIGLTTLLLSPVAENSTNGSSESTLLGRHYPDWRECLQDVGVYNLKIMTSGFLPSDPVETFGSTSMKHWIEIFRNTKKFDYVIFDTAPCLVVSDSILLAAATDARVIMILRANQTKYSSAFKAKERFEKVNADIAGVVLNDVNDRDENYYGYYGYYYKPQDPVKPNG